MSTVTGRQRRTQCPNCAQPYEATGPSLPKLLRCGHSACMSCLTGTPVVIDRSGDRAVPCPTCSKLTPLSQSANCATDLITNGRFVLAATQAGFVSRNASSMTGDGGVVSFGGDADADAGDARREARAQRNLSRLPTCEAPLCVSKASGRCSGCSGAAYCTTCFGQHLTHLPHNLQPLHTFGSAADSASCDLHQLKRHLFCVTHHRAICPTCAQLEHRNCPNVHDLASVVDTLHPQIEQRSVKLFELFRASLASCHDLQAEIARVDDTTRSAVAALLASAEECVRQTLATVFAMQSAAFERRRQLDDALRCLATEAADFAEEVDEIRDLFGAAAAPDPVALARHAPAEEPSVGTVVAAGDLIEARLQFTVVSRVAKQWARRGAALPPKEWVLPSAAEVRSRRNSNPGSTTIGFNTVAARIKRVFGSRQGAAADQFSHPQGVAVLPDGGLVVCDTMNHRLQFVDVDTGSFRGSVRVHRVNRPRSDTRNAGDVMVAVGGGGPQTFVSGTATVAAGSPDRPSSRPGVGGARHRDKSIVGTGSGNATTTTSGAVNALPSTSPGFPSSVVVLRNGLVFALDLELRCAYFVDPVQMVQVAPPNDATTTTTTTTMAADAANADADLLSSWAWPPQWRRPTAMALLPDGDVAVIDEARHLVSVLSREMATAVVVREFDGVDVTERVVDEATGRAAFVARRYVMESTADGVHDDIVHRVASPLSLCVVPPPTDFFLASAVGDGARDDAVLLQHLQRQQREQQRREWERVAAAAANDHTGDEHFDVTAPVPTMMAGPILPGRPQPRAEAAAAAIPSMFAAPARAAAAVAVARSPPPAAPQCLLAVCSTGYVSLIDAHSGKFCRFLGGDASARRPFVQPWAVAATPDGQRVVVVDSGQACMFAARVSDGAVVGKIDVVGGQRLYPRHCAVLPTLGLLAVCDSVHHTVNVLDVQV